MEAGDDYQMLLDRVRARVGEKRFALGTQLIESHHDPLEIAEGYARVAEAAIDVLTKATITEFEQKHGQIPWLRIADFGLGAIGR